MWKQCQISLPNQVIKSLVGKYITLYSQKKKTSFSIQTIILLIKIV